MKHSADTTAQCQRLLAHLKKHGSISTPQARHDLDIVQPAARIFQLRHQQGYNIVTADVYETNPGGGVHRFANYILRPGQYGEPVKKAA